MGESDRTFISLLPSRWEREVGLVFKKLFQ